MSESPNSTDPPALNASEQVPAAKIDTELGTATPIIRRTIPIVTGKLLAIELLLLVAWIAVSDLLLYQANTFLSWALFFTWSVVFFLLAKSFLATHAVKRKNVACAVLALGIAALAMRLVWCGTWLQATNGLFLTLCFVMALSGRTPYLPEAIAFIAWVVSGTWNRLLGYRIGTLNEATGVVKPALGIQILLPLFVVALFSGLFVLANPNVSNWVAAQVETGWTALTNLLTGVGIAEVAFWLVSGWLMLGLLHPFGEWLLREKRPKELSQVSDMGGLYGAYRNTLLSVIVLFGMYLAFEFATLWFREFPKDFYYAGYAHRGAFWLTVALALSTLVLSVVFQGQTLSDQRLPRLKRLALTWSALNFLLSLAAFNRLLIYVDYNGMTRLRVIGLLGIASVVVGFGLVVVKIVRDRDFVWLLHRQLWVPFLATLAFAILPVDWIVNRYNASQVLASKQPAAVQISAHLTSAEGVLPLVDLMDCEQPEIRDGVRALLALWALELRVSDRSLPQPDARRSRFRSDDRPKQSLATRRQAWKSDLGHFSPWAVVEAGFSQKDHTATWDWLNYQIAERSLETQLRQTEEQWSIYAESPTERDAALNAFFRYTYQWY